MTYFPIVQELFDSDLYIFILIGFVVALLIGLTNLNIKTRVILMLVSIAVYLLCEIVLNIYTNNLMMLLLFIGAFSIGAFIGFVLTLIIYKLRNRAKQHT